MVEMDKLLRPVNIKKRFTSLRVLHEWACPRENAIRSISPVSVLHHCQMNVKVDFFEMPNHSANCARNKRRWRRGERHWYYFLYLSFFSCCGRRMSNEAITGQFFPSLQGFPNLSNFHSRAFSVSYRERAYDTESVGTHLVYTLCNPTTLPPSEIVWEEAIINVASCGRHATIGWEINVVSLPFLF